MAVKLKFSKWIANPILIPFATGYHVESLGWRASGRAHGRSKGVVRCPCCLTDVDIYIWSFTGSGKRCTSCNVFLGTNGAFINSSEITKEQLEEFKNTK